MLPILTVSGTPGLVYLNGRFCGETGAAALPITPDGTQYLEMRPFDPGARGAVLRLTMENGRLTSALPSDVFGVEWPGGWIALEMRGSAPGVDETYEPELLAQLDMPGGRYLLVQEGSSASFGRDADESIPLPAYGIAGAVLRPLPYAGLCIAEGSCAGGRFAAVFRAQDAPELVEAAIGVSARVDGQGIIEVLEAEGDLVGHGTMRTIAPDAQGRYSPRSEETVWADGGPRWPQSPLDTARAWLEALRLGLQDEAAGYLLRPERAVSVSNTAGVFDSVADLPADGKGGVRLGVLSMEGPNLARVKALSFSIAQQPGPQGPFKIEAVEEVPCD